MSEELKRKIEMVCRFTNSKVKICNGSIRNIKKTNVAFVEPHQIIIGGTRYLMFDENDYVFVNNLYNKIPFKNLENHINNFKCLKKK